MAHKQKAFEKLQERIIDFLRDAKNPTHKRSGGAICSHFSDHIDVPEALEMLWAEQKVEWDTGAISGGRRVNWFTYNPYAKPSSAVREERLRRIEEGLIW